MNKLRRFSIYSMVGLVALDASVLWDAPTIGVAAAAIIFQLAGFLVGKTVGMDMALSDVWSWVKQLREDDDETL